MVSNEGKIFSYSIGFLSAILQLNEEVYHNISNDKWRDEREELIGWLFESEVIPARLEDLSKQESIDLQRTSEQLGDEVFHIILPQLVTAVSKNKLNKETTYNLYCTFMLSTMEAVGQILSSLTKYQEEYRIMLETSIEQATTELQVYPQALDVERYSDILQKLSHSSLARLYAAFENQSD